MPKFLVGMSLGGRVSIKVAETLKDEVKGQGLMVPYIKSTRMAGLMFDKHIKTLIETMYPNMLTQSQLSEL